MTPPHVLDPCTIYTNGIHNCLIVSSDYNNGTGAVVCRLGIGRSDVVNMKRARLWRSPAFLIQDNDAGDISEFVLFRPIIPLGSTLNPKDAARALHFATRKLEKNKNPEYWNAIVPFESTCLRLAVEVLDRIVAQMTDLKEIKYYIRIYDLPMARDIYVDLSYKSMCARKVQRFWRMALANPAYDMCKRRLLREFNSLIE